MSEIEIEKYRLSWRSAPVGYLVVVFVVLCIFSWPHMYLILALLSQLALALVLMLLISVITVTNEGIVLYFVNRLQWSQVVSVKRASFLGLPYLQVKRSKGLNWWLPLYFVGHRPIEQALAEKAPPGNPLHSYAAENT